jgi:hypothetical protein
MSSAKKEFISHLEEIQENNKEVKVTSAIIVDARTLRYGVISAVPLDLIIVLHPNYSDSEYNNFLEALNFEYYSGYGVQELYGYIWYNEGTWSERYEYDGREWWVYKKCPSFQDYLEELKADLEGEEAKGV